MSNINNTLSTTINRNSALSMNELALKTWYSNLHISSASSKNRISPTAAPVPASNNNNKSTLQEPPPSSPSLSYLFRKIARTPTRTLSRSSTMMSHASWKKHQQHVYIYLKSPHVVASGELAGSIVIHGDTTLVHKIKGIHLDLVGREAVNDTSKTTEKSYTFLNLSVLQLTGSEQVTPYHVSAKATTTTTTEEINKIIVPFLVSLPSDLSGTYVDKKGSIQYYLKSEIQWHADKPTCYQQAVLIYSNMVLKSLKDATDLYTPVMLNNKEIWKTTKEGHVSIKTSMPRSVWMSGAPIYVTVNVHNDMLSDTVTDIKLELLRKQNTYSIHQLDQSLVSVTSPCETLVTTCLADLGWWKPLEPASQDQVTLTIDTPPNQVTVRNQKLIDVSFSIRLSMQSMLNANTVVSDIPVMLVHPISMDPPPGNYTKSITTSNTEECHLILQEAVTKIATQSTISVSSTPSLVSSYTESDGTRSLSEMNVPTRRRRLTSMKKSLSKWGLQLSRKISISSGINSHCESSDRHSNAEKTKLSISSPLISSSPSSSSLHSSVCSTSTQSLQSDQANEEITRIIKNKKQQQKEDGNPPEKSIMKFGHITGPKRFGQQPGCLGDAGLDIRNCFNVATATEAIQCYAAEKVEIPLHLDDKEEEEEEGNDYYYILPPYLEPTQFSELIKKKELVMAPHAEKCQIDPDMMSKRQIQQYEQDHYGSLHQKEDKEEEDTLTELEQDQDQDQQQEQHGSSTKRILASSRHLRNVQRKSVQVSRDGRALLTFSK